MRWNPMNSLMVATLAWVGFALSGLGDAGADLIVDVPTDGHETSLWGRARVLWA
jgi:hypothetical protein